MGTMVKVWKIPDRKVRPHFNLQVIGNINITNKRWGRGCKITISNAFGQHSLNKNVVIASQFGCAFFHFMLILYQGFCKQIIQEESNGDWFFWAAEISSLGGRKRNKMIDIALRTLSS